MKQRIFSITIMLMSLFISVLSAQNSNNPKTTQEILMSYKWVPMDMYELDYGESSFLTYTKTHEIDSVETEEGEIETYVAPYYLSDTEDAVFDKSKVGKMTTGRYLIMNRSSDPDIICTFIYELVELSEEKMIMRHLTPGMSIYGHTNTFLARSKV